MSKHAVFLLQILTAIRCSVCLSAQKEAEEIYFDSVSAEIPIQ
jgi:hypothetical protein